MALAYKTPSDSLTAAEWSALLAAADAALTTAFGGLSFLLTGASGYTGSNKKYFLGFDPNSPPSTGLHPLAAAALSTISGNLSVAWGAAYSQFYTQYNQTAKLAAVAALAVDSGTTVPPAVGTAFAVTRVNGGTTVVTLDDCLSVIYRSGNAVVLRNSSGVVPELLKPYDLIEIIIVNNQTFDWSWDKYYNYRLHNFGSAPATVTFWDITVTIPAGGCKCVRCDLNTYADTVQGNYFLYPVAGNPRFFNFNGDTNTATNPFAALPLFEVLWEIGGNFTYGHTLVAGTLNNPDLTRFWDMSALYCDAATANKYFPPVSSAATIFDLLCHRGTIQTTGAAYGQITAPSVQTAGTGYSAGDIVTLTGGTGFGGYPYATCLIDTVDGTGRVTLLEIKDPGAYTVSPLNGSGNANTTGGTGTGLVVHATYLPPTVASSPRFTAFADLPAILGGLFAGTVTFDAAARKFYYTGRLNNSTWSDVGTPLLYLLTYGAGHAFGATDAGLKTTPTLLFDISGFSGVTARQRRLTTQTVATNYTYATWTLSGTTYSTTGTATVTVNNLQLIADATDTTWYSFNYYPSDPVSAVVNALLIPNNAQNQVGNFTFALTAAGPVIGWTETFPLNAGFDLTQLDLTTNFISAVIINSGASASLQVQRGLVLDCGTGLFPTLPGRGTAYHFWGSGQFTPFHFPRQSRVYALERAVTVTDWEPWNLLQTGSTVAAYVLTITLTSTSGNVSPGNGDIYTIPGGTLGTGGVAATVITSVPGVYPAPYSFAILNPGHYSTPPSGAVSFHLNGPGGGGTGFFNVTSQAATITPNPVTSYEPPNLKRYFENQPVAAGWDNAPEPTPAAVLNYSDNRSWIGAVDLTPGHGPAANSTNLLRCQVEHYNLLAGQVNTLPVTPAKYNNWTSLGTIAGGNFLPAYGPTGVPASLDTYGNPVAGPYFPRTAFYSWLAPSSGTDTTAAYFTAQGLTVQTTLPDGYGTAILNRYGKYTAGAYSEADGAAGDYLAPFDTTFQTACARYRWITIDAARTLYAKFNVPIVINATCNVVTFYNRVAALNAVALVPSVTTNTFAAPSFDATACLWGLTYSSYNTAPAWGAPVFFGISPTTTPGSFVNDFGFTAFGLEIYQSIPDNYTNDLTTANFSVRRAGFAGSADMNGNYCISAADQMGTYAPDNWTPGLNLGMGGYLTKEVGVTAITGSFVTGGIQPGNAGRAGITVLTWSQTVTITPYVIEFDYGPLNNWNGTGYGDPAGGLPKFLLVLLENAPSEIVARVPKNYAHAQPGFISANRAAIGNLGYPIVPIIADNTVENSAPEITYLDGTGGAGACEHLITTQLANAVLTLIPVSGYVPPPPTGGAGGSGGAGGGTGAGGAGGGGGGL